MWGGGRASSIPIAAASAAAAHLHRALAAMSKVTCQRGNHPELAVCLLHGRATLRDLTHAVERSLHLCPGGLLLWSAVDGDLTRLSLDHLGALVERALLGPRSPRRWAILARPGPTLAAASLLERLAEERGARGCLRACASRDAALEWLGIREHPTTPSPPNLG